jgi:hypothetical protein
MPDGVRFAPCSRAEKGQPTIEDRTKGLYTADYIPRADADFAEWLGNF